jgi:DNA mismatch repair ATPase MutS
MGDFYELFFEDAKTASRVLGLTLTSREKGENPVPMAGFPHHQLDQYLAKLIAAGYRAGVCDQVEDAKKAKGLVRREITRIVSRGTLTDDALLDASSNNFLAAIAGDDPAGLAWVDVSTGQFEACTLHRDRLDAMLARLEPAECLVAESESLSQNPRALTSHPSPASRSRLPDGTSGAMVEQPLVTGKTDQIGRSVQGPARQAGPTSAGGSICVSSAFPALPTRQTAWLVPAC